MTITTSLRCQGCGCTNERACSGGCHWVATNPPFCSECLDAAELPNAAGDAEHFDGLMGDRCPASPVPALHTPIWLDTTSGYCARCREPFYASEVAA